MSSKKTVPELLVETRKLISSGEEKGVIAVHILEAKRILNKALEAADNIPEKERLKRIEKINKAFKSIQELELCSLNQKG
jgi:hypothetical protein